MIDARLAEITEDRRADYLFDTKQAAEAVGCHPNKFGDWYYRTKRKLEALAVAQPGPAAAEFLGIIVNAEAIRQRHLNPQPRADGARP